MLRHCQPKINMQRAALVNALSAQKMDMEKHWIKESHKWSDKHIK